MVCPRCAHEFAPLPLLTDELRAKTAVLLDLLEDYARVHGPEISSRELNRKILEAARILGLHRFDMQAPRRYVQGIGVVRHASDGAGGEIRLHWVIDAAKIRSSRTAGRQAAE
jgi:hypothetical protein